MANLSFSLKEMQNSARFNYAAVTIRDGPLEKLWGRGDFQAAGIFFVTKFFV